MMPQFPQRAVAAPWHTIVILLLLSGLSLAGALAGHRFGTGSSARTINYILTIAMQWMMVAFIVYGVKKRGLRICDLVAGRWTRIREIFRDLGIGIVFMIVCGIILNGLGAFLGVAPNETIKGMLPQNGGETMLWIAMSITAGFCEETIFRGYLMRQFSALTQVTAGGIVLQGIAFGAAHGYQGWRYMLLIAVFGILFGLLAHWRRSLRPGMIAHGLQDTLAGLLWRHMAR
jgi:membrane protease YdiL (CAAX protease family)